MTLTAQRWKRARFVYTLHAVKFSMYKIICRKTEGIIEMKVFENLKMLPNILCNDYNSKFS